ncbi:alpha/beta fold hydrolase [Catelliglobosispora koreensis]|uniref:alpha/beta fold hydrolase n=1 Tax=Catelliglobosispora koreensis TaxID=129052 RepID=UPI0003A10284|nr:alpha/beta hydrolase [Catelliglobosispora koreensis]
MLVNAHKAGSGTPLVLIHGIGHRWQAWEPVLDLLAPHHEVIAIDLPGFGKSPVPDGGMPQGMAETVARVGEYFAQEGLDKPHVAGNSLGGAIALELAAAGLVSSATAFSPAGFYNEPERRRALRILTSMRYNTFLPGPVMKVALRTSLIRKLSFGPIVAYPDRLALQRVYEDALAMRRGKGYQSVVKASVDYQFGGTPTVPVTVAWGAKDWIFLPHQASRAAEKLPEARHETLPNCGHVPMSDAPDLVASLILQTTKAT